MHLLVTGTRGQVVQALNERCDQAGIELTTFGRPVLDLADAPATESAVGTAIAVYQPDVVVNAAAYTAVERAEKETDLAMAINGAGAGAVARASAAAGLPLIQLSTDYVFNGEKPTAYTENDKPAPINVYGRSKLNGELVVTQGNWKNIIIRTSWVYSPFGTNFVKTILHLAEHKDLINVVGDQVGNPTSAHSIANAILFSARRLVGTPSNNFFGTYHYAGADALSWASFAKKIITISSKLGGPYADIITVSALEYPTTAKRPINSSLDSSLFQRTIPDCRLSDQHDLDDVIRRILAS